MNCEKKLQDYRFRQRLVQHEHSSSAKERPLHRLKQKAVQRPYRQKILKRIWISKYTMPCGLSLAERETLCFWADDTCPLISWFASKSIVNIDMQAYHDSSKQRWLLSACPTKIWKNLNKDKPPDKNQKKRGMLQKNPSNGNQKCNAGVPISYIKLRSSTKSVTAFR